ASCSSLSTFNVLVSGSHTAWLIPTTCPAGPTRKMVELETVLVSIGPENGIRMRGWMLKPSRVLSTASSAQSLGNVAHGGSGTLTRRAVTCVLSATGSRFVGNGWGADL